MKRKLRETAGSGIIWAMIVAGFMLVIVSAVLTFSLNYYQRSLRNGELRQSYLTARSAADLMIREFVGGTGGVPGGDGGLQPGACAEPRH